MQLRWIQAYRSQLVVMLLGQAPLQPTVAGRTLDVSTGGEAGLDWANIGSPTTSVNQAVRQFRLPKQLLVYLVP